MNDKAEVLAKCLDARDRGEDPEFVLQAHPELRDEIEGLLRVVDEIARARERLDAIMLRLQAPMLPRPVSDHSRTRGSASVPAVLGVGLAFVSLLAAPAFDTLPAATMLFPVFLALAFWLQHTSGSEPLWLRHPQERG